MPGTSVKVLWSIMIFFTLCLQYRLWVGEGSFAEVWRLQQTVQQQSDINQALIARNGRLDAEVMDLKSGYQVIEERARVNLGMIGRNETFYMVVSSID